MTSEVEGQGSSRTAQESMDLSRIAKLKNNIQGSYPFSDTNFQDFSRTQIDFSRALKFSLTPTLDGINKMM